MTGPMIVSFVGHGSDAASEESATYWAPGFGRCDCGLPRISVLFLWNLKGALVVSSDEYGCDLEFWLGRKYEVIFP